MGAVARPTVPPAVSGSRTLRDGSKPAVFSAALLAASSPCSSKRFRCDCRSVPALRARHAAVLAPRAQLQEGLEAGSASSAEASCEMNTVLVKFILNRECLFGQQFFVVGSDPNLGLWDTSAAVPLEWSEGHVWTSQLDLPVEKSVKYKFILRGISGEIEWQPGEDRVLQPWETTNTIIVTEEWENGEKQRIDVEEHRNEGEQSTVDEDLYPVSKKVFTDGSLNTTEIIIMEENIGISTDDIFINGNADNVNEQNHISDKAVLVPGLPRERTLLSGLPISPVSKMELSESRMSFSSSEKLAAVFEEIVDPARKFDREGSDISLRSGEFENTKPKDGPDSTLKVKNEGQGTTVTREPFANEPNLMTSCNDLAVKANEGTEDSLPVSQVVRHDIRWGRETLHRFLSTLGLFLGESA